MCVTSGLRGVLGCKEINCVLLGARTIKKQKQSASQYVGISVSKTTKEESIL